MAAVCGVKRSFREDFPLLPVVSKRLRCSSPALPSQFRPPTALIDQLKAMFSDVDVQFLERASHERNNDLNAVVKSPHDIRLISSESASAEESNPSHEKKGAPSSDDGVASPENPSAPKNPPNDGAEFIELLIKELMGATSVEDAKVRAAKLLGSFKKTVSSHACAMTDTIGKENSMLKEQVERLRQENTVLRRAVVIQHERQKEYEHKDRELQHLKELVPQYRKQLRKLEVKNHALSMHLKEAQKKDSIPGIFHPVVF